MVWLLDILIIRYALLPFFEVTVQPHSIHGLKLRINFVLNVYGCSGRTIHMCQISREEERLCWKLCGSRRVRARMSNWFAVICHQHAFEWKHLNENTPLETLCTFDLESIRQFTNNKYLFGHLVRCVYWAHWFDSANSGGSSSSDNSNDVGNSVNSFTLHYRFPHNLD